MNDKIVTLPRSMPEWAVEQEREIKRLMAEMQERHRQEFEPLIRSLTGLYNAFPQQMMVLTNAEWPTSLPDRKMSEQVIKK